MAKPFWCRAIFGAVVVACAAACTKSGDQAPADHLPAGALLESTRAVIPAGFVLRDVHDRGIGVTKASEGWAARLYNDVANYCTIGYGHLVKKARCDGSEPEEFRRGLTPPEGERILVSDMGGAQYTVMTAVRVPMTDGQFGALVDFTFNVGGGNFKASTLLKVVNAGRTGSVSAQFRRWVMADGKPWPGLVNRREREVELFFQGIAQRGLPAPDENVEPIDIQRGE